MLASELELCPKLKQASVTEINRPVNLSRSTFIFICRTCTVHDKEKSRLERRALNVIMTSFYENNIKPAWNWKLVCKNILKVKFWNSLLFAEKILIVSSSWIILLYLIVPWRSNSTVCCAAAVSDAKLFNLSMINDISHVRISCFATSIHHVQKSFRLFIYFFSLPKIT